MTADDGSTIRVYPVDEIDGDTVVIDEIDGRMVVVLRDATNDIAVYEASPAPVDRKDGTLVDDDGERWEITHDALESESDERELSRVSGRHGLFFAFRSQYETVEVGSN